MVWAISLSTYNLLALSLSALFLKLISLLVLLTSKEPIKRPPKLISALPKSFFNKTHYLNSFRRKPAITKYV